MRKPAKPGAPCAVIIPFPRYSRPAGRKAEADFNSPDFNAGFEFAMAMLRSLKGNGQLFSTLKGV